MSKLDFMSNLLKNTEVEWKTLGDISIIYGGLTGKSKNDFEDGNASYVPYKNIFYNIAVDFDELESVKVSTTENQREVKYGDILFTGSSEIPDEAGMSSAITQELAKTIYLNSFSFGVRFNSDIKINPHFSKYLFRSHFMRKEIIKTASGVTRFNISKARFKKLQIPIPPLNVQAEIVRILDAFTELTAELKAELKARKHQYAYYSEKLLTLNETDIEWKELGGIGDFTYGYVAKAQEAGNARFVRITDINSSGKLIADKAKYVDISEANEKFILKKNDLVMARTGATYGKTMLFEEDYPAIYAGFLIKLSFDDNVIIPKYYWHFAQSILFWSQAKKLVSGGGQPQFNANVLKLVKIPIPPLAEQKSIVAILDKFDALTTSLTEGLPREMALRQQQYEYYRELLLSFPKPEVAIHD